MNLTFFIVTREMAYRCHDRAIESSLETVPIDDVPFMPIELEVWYVECVTASANLSKLLPHQSCYGICYYSKVQTLLTELSFRHGYMRARDHDAVQLLAVYTVLTLDKD